MVGRREGTRWGPRYEWKVFDPLESAAPIYRQVLTHSLAERLRWRAEYEAAKARASPHDVTASSSR